MSDIYPVVTVGPVDIDAEATGGTVRLAHSPSPRLFELAFRDMLNGWQGYANAHALRYASSISEDYVLGPAWADIGRGLLSLLNGELGRLDGGTLDREIRETFLLVGFTDEGTEVES